MEQMVHSYQSLLEIHLQTQATTALWCCLVASLPFPTSQIPNAHTPSTINRKKNRSRRLQSLSSPPRTQGSRATPPLAMFEVRAYALSERPSLQGLGSDSDSNFISTDSFHLSAGHPLLRPTHLLVSTLLNLVNTSSGPPSSAVSVHIATTEPRAKSTSI